MLGNALKLGYMASATGVDSTEYFFPAGRWCEVICHKMSDCCFTQEESGQVRYSSRADQFALHLREKFIVPMQDATAISKRKSSNKDDYV